MLPRDKALVLQTNRPRVPKATGDAMGEGKCRRQLMPSTDNAVGRIPGIVRLYLIETGRQKVEDRHAGRRPSHEATEREGGIRAVARGDRTTRKHAGRRTRRQHGTRVSRRFYLCHILEMGVLTARLFLSHPAGVPGGSDQEGDQCRASVRTDMAANCEGHRECPEEHAGDPRACGECVALGIT